jgi:hypothetical protein
VTKLAKLIATEEGFFRSGTLPSRRNNPGDLRHSRHASHVGIGSNDIGEIDSVVDGWADLERQLELDASRGMTLEQAIYSWAPPNENNTAGYLDFIINGFGGVVDAQTPLSRVLEIAA